MVATDSGNKSDNSKPYLGLQVKSQGLPDLGLAQGGIQVSVQLGPVVKVPAEETKLVPAARPLPVREYTSLDLMFAAN